MIKKIKCVNPTCRQLMDYNQDYINHYQREKERNSETLGLCYRCKDSKMIMLSRGARRSTSTQTLENMLYDSGMACINYRREERNN